jgi:glucose-1-phosphate cytidylyltransferase
VQPIVAILCGGRGTRLREHAESIPKPLVEIGGRPILWHVIQVYLAQGFERFVLLTGHRAEQLDAFAAETEWPAGTTVRCVPTGQDTPTGGRLHLARAAIGEGRFCVTYADGVADIDLRALLAEHERGGTIATMAVVRPELPFGIAELGADGTIHGFVEKPRGEQWVNAGFFCFEPGVFGALDLDAVLEREPLARLAREGQLRGFRHEGFWRCMDTYKDAILLGDLWAAGDAPWKLWN